MLVLHGQSQKTYQMDVTFFGKKKGRKDQGWWGRGWGGGAGGKTGERLVWTVTWFSFRLQ